MVGVKEKKNALKPTHNILGNTRGKIMPTICHGCGLGAGNTHTYFHANR